MSKEVSKEGTKKEEAKEEEFDWKADWTAEQWIKEWEEQDSYAYSDVYDGLRNNIVKLTNGKQSRFFIPMCADMFDMKWKCTKQKTAEETAGYISYIKIDSKTEKRKLYDQGHTVIGVEMVEKPVKNFFVKHNVEHTVEDVKDYGKVYKSTDGRVVLYVGDVLTFNKELGGGEFDVIYDVGAMQALNKGQRAGYIDMEYNLLKQGGHLFVNLVGDEDIPDDSEKVPPHFQECYDKLVSTFDVERVSRYKMIMEDHETPESVNTDWCAINNFYMCTKK